VSNTKGGSTPTSLAPAQKPGDIVVESVDSMIDEVALEQAFAMYSQMVKEMGRDFSKRWEGMPARYAPPGYVYYRCGIKGTPRAEFIRAQMKTAGWADAPAGTRCTAYLTDRENGLYICTPVSIYQRYVEIENQRVREKGERALRSKQSENVQQLRDMGIEIERAEPTEQRQMTAEEFMGTRNVKRT